MQPLDFVWVLACAFLVFVMQAGFMCVEAGITRSKNNISVAIKNITDLSLSVLCYWMIGFGLMFGTSAGGWFGTDGFAVNDLSDPQFAATLLFQSMFCGTAATILSGAVAERGAFHGYILVTLVTVLLIYPVYGHWVWAVDAEGNSAGWLGSMGFVDFAGSSVVHGVGGGVALAAILVIGPRQGRFLSARQTRRFNGSNLPLSMLGVLLLWLGWFGFNGGSAMAWTEDVPSILFNTLAAGASGVLAALLLSFAMDGKPSVFFGMNGALGGLVAVTAGCHVYGASAAVAVGALGGIAVYLGDHLLERRRIDDVVGAVPVHLMGGLTGILAVPFFALPAAFGPEVSFVSAFGVQAIGAATVLIYAAVLPYLLLRVLNIVVPLRVSLHIEDIGLNVGEHAANTDLNELFDVMQRQTRDRDFSMRAPQSPFTEVGQIGLFYNSVMFELERSFNRVVDQESALRKASDQRSKLLESVLPKSIVERMENGESRIVDQFSDATVVFADICDFTQFSMEAHAGESMALLTDLFQAFDEVISDYGLEKIKTIGDCYMFVSGVPDAKEDQCERAVDAALDLVFATRQLATKLNREINIRVGVHSGPLVAGVVGDLRFVYDVWGSTVNIASRIEEASDPGRVTASQAVIDRISSDFKWQRVGRRRLSGIGNTVLYTIEGRKASQSTRRQVAATD
ncbi:MAG: ammonium transporter [Pseudomonadota bacterium]